MQVLVDPREHLNMVMIGHVDAGKSTISGQIMLATGQIDQRMRYNAPFVYFFGKMSCDALCRHHRSLQEGSRGKRA